MDPHSNTGPLCALGTPLHIQVPSLPLRSFQGLPHPGQSPMCLVQEPPCPAKGPAGGTTAAQWTTAPLLPAPAICDPRGLVWQPALTPAPAQPALALFGLVSDFLRTKTKQKNPQKQNNKNLKIHQKTKKKNKKQILKNT